MTVFHGHLLVKRKCVPTIAKLLMIYEITMLRRSSDIVFTADHHWENFLFLYSLLHRVIWKHDHQRCIKLDDSASQQSYFEV